jgi:hypothetical protein
MKSFPIPLILKLEIQSSPNKNSFKSLFSYVRITFYPHNWEELLALGSEKEWTLHQLTTNY